ncbi:GNAT family N-acetyltransferase [Pseudonocardia nigra]|uniref:GNAT family N-acetyltransferase n=1 Tax=Pseudonocardia nigra TaxID=1921578 RepID=UPI001C5CCD7E|nr:GNAT family N-acetyltransferase [Pseudonocardia nigra]
MDDLLERIDEFCDAVQRQWARAEEHGPLRLFVRHGEGWPFYARPVPGGAPITAADVEGVRARQRELRLAEAFEWVLAAAPSMADAARATGLRVQVCPLLVLDGEPAATPLPPGYSARLLGPADGDLQRAVHALDSVVAGAFGVPAPAPPTDRSLAGLRAELAAGAVARALVTGPDGPVAAGSAQRAGDVVELVGIGTSAAARSRGLGAAVTALLAVAARDAGAELVFLAAGDACATRVYERVGFRRVGECGIAEPS